MSEEIVEVEVEEVETPEAEVQEDAPAEPSLREIISKAYDEQAAEPAEETPAAKRERDQNGRFAANQKVSDQLEEQGKTSPQGETISPPASWSSEEKERFKTLPPETQKYIAQRESERDRFLSQKANEIAPYKQKYAEIDQAIAPYAQNWAEQGISPGQGVKQLIAAQAFLEQNPVAGLQWLAQSLGVDLKNVAQAPVQSDVHYQGLQSKLSQIESRLAEREQAQMQSMVASIQRDLETFAQETDEKGQAKRPHFETLGQELVPIVARLRAENPTWTNKEVLNEAYEKAAWANPQTRQSMLEQMERRRLEDSKSKVQSAKRAGVSLNGAPNGSTMRPAPKTLRDAIEASYDLLSSKQ